ncbi:hypothetical protein [Fulvivirga sediminis]|uniref:Uncharacterized protein n=1 Tax=Fulvivirga sediminis TaxID=2803949 RepID=A0A937FE14_9BACT|nr:hypothetical protein [Fulvivirga sediminis]MBL3658813.1 hypothetical protein [Fulvivirga sediminis]
MRILNFILFLLFTFSAQAQETYLMWNDVETQRFGNTTLFKSENKFLNGPYKLAENSGSYTEATFKNGKMIGAKKSMILLVS